MTRLTQPQVLLSIFLFCVTLTGCLPSGFENKEIEKTISNKPQSVRLPAIDVAPVEREALNPPVEYIGTSQAFQEVTLRSQSEGQLLQLNVNVGDRVSQGQIIGQLDDSLAQVAITREKALLSRLNSQIEEAKAEIVSAEAEVKTAEIRLLQAQIDLDRLAKLNEEGAIAKRDVEIAQTEVQTNQQLLTAARSQVKVREARVVTIENEILSQQAVITAEEKRLTFTQIKASSDGYISEKLTEVGSLIRTGEEIVKIADFNPIKVVINVSELDLKNISLNSRAKVIFDAFEQEEYIGIIETISPLADNQTRQIPIELLVSNSDRKITSGLLSRVTFISEGKTPIVIPESALKLQNQSAENIVFIFDQSTGENRVKARKVTIGQSKNGKVEIISGLNIQDKIAVQSTRNLEDGEKVRVSAISSF